MARVVRFMGPNGSATLKGGRNEHGEYVVKFRDPLGVRKPEGDYYTNDKKDALQTSEIMVGSWNQTTKGDS